MAVLETANLTEIEFSEYCREKGIYPEQVKEWKEACINANDSVKENNSKTGKELREERKAKLHTSNISCFSSGVILFAGSGLAHIVRLSI